MTTKPEDARKKGEELKPLRERAYKEYDQNPKLTPKELAQLLGVPANVANTWKVRWKKSRKKAAAELSKGMVPGRSPVPSAPEVADALLKRVVSVLSEYDNLKKEVGELKGYKDRASDLERALDRSQVELERIIKIHNNQVESRKFTSGDELRRLAKL